MEFDLVKKLGLGAVQFGLPYGINNPSGQVLPTEVTRILSYSASIGIEVIDTASAYGISEEVLGNILATQSHSFKDCTEYFRCVAHFKNALSIQSTPIKI